jgi:hypothetical protein
MPTSVVQVKPGLGLIIYVRIKRCPALGRYICNQGTAAKCAQEPKSDCISTISGIRNWFRPWVPGLNAYFDFEGRMTTHLGRVFPLTWTCQKALMAVLGKIKQKWASL